MGMSQKSAKAATPSAKGGAAPKSASKGNFLARHARAKKPATEEEEEIAKMASVTPDDVLALEEATKSE